MRGLLRSTGARRDDFGGVIAVATVLAAFGPLLAPYDPDLPTLGLAWVGPSGGHLLGYDFEGRDVLSRLLAGAQSSMIGPLAVVVGAMTLGTLLAVVAAWRQGLTDTVISSGLDIVFAFPGILLAVLAAAVFGAGLTAAAVSLAIAYMPYVARVLRGAALKERGQPYVAALEVQGVVRHLNLPAAHRAEHPAADRGPGDDPVRLGDGGSGGHLLPRPRRAAARPELGRHDLRESAGDTAGLPAAGLAAGLCIVGVVIAFNVLGERLFERAQAAHR